MAVLIGLPTAPVQAMQRPIAQEVERVMDAAVQDGFHGAVLVARGDSVLFARGYGLANPDWSEANDATTRFAIASVTKSFTAVAVLQLAERHRLRLDDPICRYLESCPAAWLPITIEHLLAHRSGIPEYFSGHLTRNYVMRYRLDEIRALFEGRALDFAPGSAFNYSNSGYFLLGQIIERVSGQPYEYYLREHILGPLGMNDTGMNDPSRVVERRAVGLDASRPDVLRLHQQTDISWSYSAAGLYSTVGDLLRFVRGLAAGRLLSPESVRHMWSANASRYGLGWWVHSDREPNYVMATGGIVGFQSNLTYYPRAEIALVLLCNAPGQACAQAGVRLREILAAPE